MSASSSAIGWEEKKVLIIGRASPEPSKKHTETVCTGGITEDGELLRLYPIQHRYLDDKQKYKLWSWAKFDVQKNPQDQRKESYKVRQDSIAVLAFVGKVSERFSLLNKGTTKDRETLDRLKKEDGTSMGIIEIEVLEVAARRPERNWEVEKPYIKQFELFFERKRLEQNPVEIKLKYRCTRNPNCRTHGSTLRGWEYVEAFRQFRRRYRSGEVAFEYLRKEIFKRYVDPRKTTYALVGTHFRFQTWMVAQLYSFPSDIPKTLF